MSNDQALKFVNDNYKMVYPNSTFFNPLKRPLMRDNEVLMDGIQEIMNAGGSIGPKGVAAEGKEPAELYPRAIQRLREISVANGGEYYPVTRGNLNTLAGRLYLAFLRDAPAKPLDRYDEGWNAALTAMRDYSRGIAR